MSIDEPYITVAAAWQFCRLQGWRYTEEGLVDATAVAGVDRRPRATATAGTDRRCGTTTRGRPAAVDRGAAEGEIRAMTDATLTEQVLQHLDAEVAAGTSVRSIALAIGVSQCGLRAVQRREKRPGSEMLDRVAARYGLAICLTGDGDPLECRSP